MLDLKTEEGRRDVVTLAAECDIVIENFRPGTLEKWGIGPDVLTAAHPNLIITRISAFGQTCTMASQPGFAAVAEASAACRNSLATPTAPGADWGARSRRSLTEGRRSPSATSSRAFTPTSPP